MMIENVTQIKIEMKRNVNVSVKIFRKNIMYVKNIMLKIPLNELAKMLNAQEFLITDKFAIKLIIE